MSERERAEEGEEHGESERGLRGGVASLEVSRRRGCRQAGCRWPGRVAAHAGRVPVLLAGRKTTGEGPGGLGRTGGLPAGPVGGAR